MKREKYLKDITEYLSILSSKVEILNCINLYDINIIAEDFYADFLNLLFDYNLSNLNLNEKNAKAIDLFDLNNKIAIQVTSDNTSEKIKETLRKFIEEEHYLRYEKLIVLIITQKRKYTTEFNTDGKFQFKKEDHIWDKKDLIRLIRNKNDDELREIRNFLNSRLNGKMDNCEQTQANEIETIMDLIEYITANKYVREERDVIIDPAYKINTRFKEFADELTSQYVALTMVYGQAMSKIVSTGLIDQAQDIITKIYLQDISIKILKENNNNPLKALDALVDYFEQNLSKKGKKYDKVAIKFYLVNKVIECAVFPNERGEYDVSA